MWLLINALAVNSETNDNNMETKPKNEISKICKNCKMFEESMNSKLGYCLRYTDLYKFNNIVPSNSYCLHFKKKPQRKSK